MSVAGSFYLPISFSSNLVEIGWPSKPDWMKFQAQALDNFGWWGCFSTSPSAWWWRWRPATSLLRPMIHHDWLVILEGLRWSGVFITTKSQPISKQITTKMAVRLESFSNSIKGGVEVWIEIIISISVISIIRTERIHIIDFVLDLTSIQLSSLSIPMQLGNTTVYTFCRALLLLLLVSSPPFLQLSDDSSTKKPNPPMLLLVLTPKIFILALTGMGMCEHSLHPKT